MFYLPVTREARHLSGLFDDAIERFWSCLLYTSRCV